jgi:hypothetical protein
MWTTERPHHYGRMPLTQLDELYDAGLCTLDEEQRKTLYHADQREIIHGDTPTVTSGWPVAAGNGSREARPREGKLRLTHGEINPILGVCLLTRGVLISVRHRVYVRRIRRLTCPLLSQ